MYTYINGPSAFPVRQLPSPRHTVWPRLRNGSVRVMAPGTLYLYNFIYTVYRLYTYDIYTHMSVCLSPTYLRRRISLAQGFYQYDQQRRHQRDPSAEALIQQVGPRVHPSRGAVRSVHWVHSVQNRFGGDVLVPLKGDNMLMYNIWDDSPRFPEASGSSLLFAPTKRMK